MRAINPSPTPNPNLNPNPNPNPNAHPRREEHLGDLLVALGARDVQGGEAVEVGVVDVGSRSEQLPHARRVVAPRSVQQGRHASGDELLL